MKLYLLYYSCRFTGFVILGLYCNQKSAIRSGMRRVYQLMNISAKKIEGEWSWIDEYSRISVIELEVTDIKDLSGESPLPHFINYRDFLEGVPTRDLERFKIQALNRKKILERIRREK